MPTPPDSIHIMLDNKPNWVVIDAANPENKHARYPKESLEDWHRRHGLFDQE